MGLKQTFVEEWRKTDKPRREPTADRLARAERVLDKVYGHGKGKG